MRTKIAYLGPSGTYTEMASLAYGNELEKQTQTPYILCPYPTIAQTLEAVANKQVDLGVVPIENSIQGSVTLTLDTLWELDHLQIQKGLTLPIFHLFLSQAASLSEIKTVYSHPQALAQCQKWLNKHLPFVEQIATNSTTEALKNLEKEHTAGAISSQRAAEIYNLPILEKNISDYPDNTTQFWVLGLEPCPKGKHISLAFSTPANVPGALVKPLQVVADRGINLTRIESRPTKRLLGEYIFFIDLAGNLQQDRVRDALEALSNYTALLKVFGNYNIYAINPETKILEEIP